MRTKKIMKAWEKEMEKVNYFDMIKAYRSLPTINLFDKKEEKDES